nr:hypothetical protein [Tanacetum cinerariifolium]
MASDHVSSDPVPQCQRTRLEHNSLSPVTQCQDNVPHAAETVTMANELDFLFSTMFDELLNGSTLVMSKSSAVTTADDPNQQNAQVENDEFVNIFCTPVQDRGETSSHHVDSSNMHTFYQCHPSEHRWTKDHPLEQVIGNPSQSVRIRRQLESDGEMCTSINVPKEQSLNVSAGILWNVNKENLRTMASDQNSSDPVPECQTMASDQNSSDPAPECQTMASDQNSSDPVPECQTMASDQNSSDPAPECQTMVLNHDSLSHAIQRQEKVTQADRTVTTSNELDLLFSPMFEELLNGSSKVVSKSSAVSAADAPNQHQRQNHTTPLNNHTTHAPSCQIPTLAPTVISSENINQAETHAENDQVADEEFINIFSTPVQDQGETSSRHVDSSNMHTFYQRFPSEHRWTKDHPLEQVIENPSQPVRTKRQLEADAEMCMFALTVSRTEPKNIKEAMADSAWIESM